MPFSTETSKRTAACAHFRGNSVITAPPTDHKCCHALDNSNKFRNPDHCSDISLRTQNAHPFSVLLLTFASQYGWKGRLSLNVDIWLLRVCQRSAGWKFEFQCIAGEESQVESRSSAFLSISLRDWFTSADDINSFAPPSLIRKYRHFLTSYFRSIPFLFFFFFPPFSLPLFYTDFKRSLLQHNAPTEKWTIWKETSTYEYKSCSQMIQPFTFNLMCRQPSTMAPSATLAHTPRQFTHLSKPYLYLSK